MGACSLAIKSRPAESSIMESIEEIFALGRKSDLKGIHSFLVIGYISGSLNEKGLYSPISLFQFIKVMIFSNLGLVKTQF